MAALPSRGALACRSTLTSTLRRQHARQRFGNRDGGFLVELFANWQLVGTHWRFHIAVQRMTSVQPACAIREPAWARSYESKASFLSILEQSNVQPYYLGVEKRREFFGFKIHCRNERDRYQPSQSASTVSQIR